MFKQKENYVSTYHDSSRGGAMLAATPALSDVGAARLLAHGAQV